VTPIRADAGIFFGIRMLTITPAHGRRMTVPFPLLAFGSASPLQAGSL
jgi:hypothetical protein